MLTISDYLPTNDVLESLNYLSEQDKNELDWLLEQEADDAARADLISFCGRVDEPQKHWYRAAHLRRIADVLTQLQQRTLTRVIINVAPRHWKTSLTIKWCAKCLGDDPRDTFIVASRSMDLASKISKSVRETLASARYRNLYPDTRVARGYDRADDWLVEGGYQTSFRAVGTGGGIAGFGARKILLDDVSDPNKQSSETETANDWDWYKNVIRTRLEPDGIIVVVNNRVGVNDISGYLLDPERNDSADPAHVWTVIDLPALDETTGEYLWLERFGLDYYQALQNDPYLWRVQYQQRPSVEEGDKIKREWFEFVPQLPEGTREQCRVVDTAWTITQTEKQDPDYTASIGSCKHEGWLYLIDPYEVRQEMPATVEWIKEQKRAKGFVRFGMARAAGEKIATQFLSLLGIPVEELAPETADIQVRLGVFIYWARMGRVKLVGEPKRWERFLQQAASFPNGKHDDLLAVCAGLTEMHGLKIDALPTPASEQRGLREILRGRQEQRETRYMGEFAPKAG